MDALNRVVVVGTGVVGTSIALALRARGVEVGLVDRDPAAVRLAEDLGAGSVRGDTASPVDLAVLAVPPDAVPETLLDAGRERLAHVCTDVGSVKVAPLSRARELGCDMASFVGGHPLAGRERSGPAAARADLFTGRPWVLCPSTESTGAAVDAVTELVRACGAEPVTLAPEVHDHAVALVSHLPHVAASTVAARLHDADPTALGLAGQGLRDTTRIAAGDPELWNSILRANAGPVADILDEMVADLLGIASELRKGGQGPDTGAVSGLLVRGRDGRARVPGKRGGRSPEYVVVPVVIRDRPGELARLFAAAGETGVNIEDVALEHSPGLPVGVVELSVHADSADTLVDGLHAAGWSVHTPPRQ